MYYKVCVPLRHREQSAAIHSLHGLLRHSIPRNDTIPSSRTVRHPELVSGSKFPLISFPRCPWERIHNSNMQYTLPTHSMGAREMDSCLRRNDKVFKLFDKGFK